MSRIDTGFEGPWFKTPWWWPPRWFGFDLMREDGHFYDPGHEYGRARVVAHELLRDAYAVDVDPRDIKR